MEFSPQGFGRETTFCDASQGRLPMIWGIADLVEGTRYKNYTDAAIRPDPIGNRRVRQANDRIIIKAASPASLSIENRP